MDINQAIAMIHANADKMELAHLMPLVPLIHEAGQRELGLKLFDNYNFRTVLVYSEVKRNIWDDLTLSLKRTGGDARSLRHNLADVEFKTSGDYPPSFMWDKQPDAVRREETLRSDAFVLGEFVNERNTVILVAKAPETLAHIRTLMEQKQKKLINRWNDNVAAGKRGGDDAIHIDSKDLLTPESDVRWSIWVRGTWYHDVTSSTCKELWDADVLAHPRPKREKPKIDSAANAIDMRWRFEHGRIGELTVDYLDDFIRNAPLKPLKIGDVKATKVARISEHLRAQRTS
jgi:hypothetical protein